jgi:hypothetical protein
MDKQTMREFDDSCLTPVRPLTPEEIRALREREGASQAVFDALADAPRGTVCLEGGFLKIDRREPRRELATSIRELRRARQLVISDADIIVETPCSVARGYRCI